MKLETISASRITGYLMCPRKFAFRYVEQVPPAHKAAALAFGSAVHSALETFHMERLAGREPIPEAIETLFLIDWQAATLDALSFRDGEDAASLATLGTRLVAAYIAAHQDIEVVAVEAPFQVPLADPATGELLGPDLIGVFDAVLAGGTVQEIKTAARGYDHGTLARHVQLTAYAYAHRHLTGAIPRLRVAALMKQKSPKCVVHGANRSEDDLAWFVHLAAEVCRGIEAECFPPNPGWGCADCEYAGPCAAWRGRSLVQIGRAA